MVELIGIKKYFSSNGIKALDGANFNLDKGEIHALLGENGAGKSTLMHIMAGFMRPGGEGIRGNSGTILVNGKEKHFSSTASALAAGIGMVRQHPHHIPGFLVWESCVTGFGKNVLPFINRRYYRKQVSSLNERLCFNLPLDSPAEALSVSQGQKAAILTLLLRNTQYLVFDEPAAILSPAETETLYELFSTLKNEGKGIVLVSHNLEETLKIADRVTVLRQGKTQICSKADELSNERLYDLIFGIDSAVYMHPEPSGNVKKNAPAVTLDNFTVNVPGYPLIRGINLKLEQGRITGIAGVRDSGLETLERALTGFLPFSGTLQINGKELPGAERRTAKRVRTFRSLGGTYLGMRNEGTALPIRDILLIHAHRRFQKFGILNPAEINQWIESVMKAAKIPLRTRAAGNAFSGGQLQRLLLAREMAEQGILLVLSEPGWSLDGQYRKRLASLLREKANNNTAVVIFSTDVEDLLDFSDSVAVLRDGAISAVVELKDHAGNAKQAIQKAMVGRI